MEEWGPQHWTLWHSRSHTDIIRLGSSYHYCLLQRKLCIHLLTCWWLRSDVNYGVVNCGSLCWKLLQSPWWLHVPCLFFALHTFWQFCEFQWLDLAWSHFAESMLLGAQNVILFQMVLQLVKDWNAAPRNSQCPFHCLQVNCSILTV